MRAIRVNLINNIAGVFVFQSDVVIIIKNGIVESIQKFSIFVAKFPNQAIEDLTEYIALPGFVDAHSHFPQHYITGIGNGELLDWLNNYVFPTEAKLDNYELAYKQAFEFFTTAIAYGTTRIVSYSTSSELATDAAFQAANDLNIQAMIGNTMMDSFCLDGLKKTKEENIVIGERIAKKWHNANNGRLQYIVTPRFAGSCSFDLLKMASEFAVANDLIIQTHLAENLSELEFIKSTFPECMSYTDVYFKSGILRENTVLAHCIYLSEDEIAMIKDSGAVICHCPSSNIFLGSGIMPARKYLNTSLALVLGSDVGGGESLSMLAEMKSAIEASKLNLLLVNQNESSLAPNEIFNIMYAGNNIFDKQIKYGLNEGDYADLVFYRKDKILSNPLVLSIEDILAQLIYTCSNKYADKVLLMGREIG